MHIQEFDYDLPPELVAQHPAEERDRSRLMVLHRKGGGIEHRLFFDIIDYLQEGDVLVLNDTRVIPARLLGKKQTGGKTEVFLLPTRAARPASRDARAHERTSLLRQTSNARRELCSACRVL